MTAQNAKQRWSLAGGAEERSDHREANFESWEPVVIFHRVLNFEPVVISMYRAPKILYHIEVFMDLHCNIIQFSSAVTSNYGRVVTKQ